MCLVIKYGPYKEVDSYNANARIQWSTVEYHLAEAL